MIVKPRYLVPDTNCFVDMLKYIRTIVDKSVFVVAVPLTGKYTGSGILCAWVLEGALSLLPLSFSLFLSLSLSLLSDQYCIGPWFVVELSKLIQLSLCFFFFVFPQFIILSCL